MKYKIQITKLPSQIRELHLLEEFLFANNSVKEIPPTIKSCKHLTKLDFSGKTLFRIFNL